MCVSSGQVFRWRRSDSGRWVGTDGPNWFAVRIEPVGASFRYEVDSNAGEKEFSRLFRLDVRLSDVVRQILEVDPRLREYANALPGLRVLAPCDPEEVLFSFLCTANNNMARIVPMVRAIASYGEPIGEVESETVFRFPPAERLAAIREEELRAKGFGYRAATIPAVARVLAAKPTGWLDSQKKAAYQDVHGALLGIPGIGPKLADCIALFGLHQMEAVPVDTHLWQAACRLDFPEWRGKALTDSRYRAVGDRFRSRFGDLAAWAHQYLFYENLLNGRARRTGTLVVR